ncbi:MAG: 2-oxo acid dehydrogenase subunit E2 [Fimbriimonadaceae bacterium]|jgi:pyruvate dehydrogenase E2 component (dihydrolipoamide acetyltransferase)|nr:2-oxo acid dehydrogenase subunit E2 [Fimbriimonadaceae bacterium]
MPEVSLKIPQIGEGLQEARVVAFLKNPGDLIKRDEPIYQMETDKAVMDVESPYSGRLVKWLASPDDILPIGADIMVIETNEETPTEPHAPQSPGAEAAPALAGDQRVSLKIPQIGEGLQEARIVALLKQVGEKVKRDEPIYQMETDKAVMDVECPYEGTVLEWLAKVDEVLPIGADVLVLQTQDEISESSSHGPAAPTPTPALNRQSQAQSTERRRDIPPRTRAYAKQKGISEEVLATIPASGSKLMPEDIDSYLFGGSPTPTSAPKATGSGKSFSENPLASKQRVLASRLMRGSQLVVPGMMTVCANWGEIETLRQEIKENGGDFQPSTFTLFAYCVAQAAKNHPIMRSTLVGDSTVRTYDHLQLGIAVSLPGDELVVAVVEDSDKLSWTDFANQAREKIALARSGKDQANESVTLSITNMQGYGIREAMAVVVPPGVATIFLGEAFNGLAQDTSEIRLQRSCNIGITIDHRLINGVGGAEFLNAIKANVEGIRGLVNL